MLTHTQNIVEVWCLRTDYQTEATGGGSETAQPSLGAGCTVSVASSGSRKVRESSGACGNVASFCWGVSEGEALSQVWSWDYLGPGVLPSILGHDYQNQICLSR